MAVLTKGATATGRSTAVQPSRTSRVPTSPREKRERIALLTNASAWGGTEVHTVQLAETLEERGHDVLIVELGEPVYSRHAGPGSSYGVRDLELSSPFETVGVTEWVRLLRALQASTGVLVKSWYFGTSLPLELAARVCFQRFVTIEHHPSDPPPERSSGRYPRGALPRIGWWWWKARAAERLRARLPHAVVAVSDAVRSGLRERGFSTSRIERVHNGIDTEAFQRRTAAADQLRRQWGVPQEAVVFGAVGRLHEIKGYDVAIEAFARLSATYPESRMRLLLAGVGPQQDELRDHARTAGVGEKVIFPGWVEHSRDALSVIDVFVMPSHEEGLGIALIEAMACGCAPVAMAVGGVGEVLSRPDLGWLVPAGDSEAFFRAMETALLDGPEARATMSARARKHVLQHFRADHQFPRIAALVEGPRSPERAA